jgi:TetR/AcrR family transcriptional repressor of nem operon
LCQAWLSRTLLTVRSRTATARGVRPVQRDDTRSRLVEAARKLFLSKGYASTSISDILQEAGANSGSLYHFFETKQDLLVAVLDSYCTGLGPMLLYPAWQGVGDPMERVFALLGRYRELLIMSDFSYGCPIGSIALELHEPDPAVRKSLAANFSAWRKAVQECLAEANLEDGTSSDDLATLVLAVMEGAVMQSRTYGSVDTFDACVGQLRRLLMPLRRIPERRSSARGSQTRVTRSR